jgi:hypothetical protein
MGGLLFAAAMWGSVPAHGSTLTNGDFETGDFTGWATIVDPAWDSVDAQRPQSGSYAAFFGNPAGTSSISQTLNTSAGGTYEVSFWLMSEADAFGATAPNSFAFDWGGERVLQLIDQVGFGYTKFQYVLKASSAATQLSFSFTQQPAFWDFDTVVVASQVPEPGRLWLTVTGLAGALLPMAATRRRRKAKSVGRSANVS